MLEEQLAGLCLGMFIIRNDSLIFISAGAFSGFPLCLYHWLHDCDCWEGESGTWMGMRGRHLNWRGQRSSHRSAHPKCRAAGTVWLGEAEAAHTPLGLHHYWCCVWVLEAYPCQKTLHLLGSCEPDPAGRGAAAVPCGAVIILFPSALSLNKMMSLQSHSVCVQGTEIFSLFRKSTLQMRFLEEEQISWGSSPGRLYPMLSSPHHPLPKAA